HSVTAVDVGSSPNRRSSALTLVQGVNSDATTTALSSSLNPSNFGQTVMFTATVTVTAPGAGTATGTVTFKDGSTVLGTGTLNASVVASFGTASLSVGSHGMT